MKALHILVVEDDDDVGRALKSHLQDMGYEVSGPAPTCSAALEMIWAYALDLAFVDTQLGSETCDAVIDECKLLGIPMVVTHDGVSGSEPASCTGQSIIAKSYSAAALQDTMATMIRLKR